MDMPVLAGISRYWPVLAETVPTFHKLAIYRDKREGMRMRNLGVTPLGVTPLRWLGTFVFLAAFAAAPAKAAPDLDLPNGTVISTDYQFGELLKKVEAAVRDAGLGVVAVASASRGAESRGVKISGNAVVMVFRNDIAVRLLEANVAAGFEAPLRLYITENADGTATLSFKLPSVVFAPYGNGAVAEIARDLDRLFEKIGADVANQ